MFALPAQAAQEVTTTILSPEISVSSTLMTTSTEDMVTTTVVNEVLRTRELINEPNIRVGLYKNAKPVDFVAHGAYDIVSGEENVATLNDGDAVKIYYKKGVYYIEGENVNWSGENFVRLVPQDGDGYFDLKNCGRKLSGRKGDFCAYRGVFEFRYSPKSKMPYFINELPLEQYMKGITETDNNSAEGYIKAVLVAARGYAYKNISFSPPTEKRMFDVYATTQDQLYLGYSSEKQMLRVAKFAQETTGEMVTYNSNVVTTPYFSRSNGKTKTWKNNKGVNDRPWLVSVECQYDKKKKQLGHGIGMSTHDALMRATKDGWSYLDLLKHYYTGTEVEQMY